MNGRVRFAKDARQLRRVHEWRLAEGVSQLSVGEGHVSGVAREGDGGQSSCVSAGSRGDRGPTMVIVRLLRHPEGKRTITLNPRPVRPALLGGSDYLFEYPHEGSAPWNCTSSGTAGLFGNWVGVLVLPFRVIRRPDILRRQRFIGGELFISPNPPIGKGL